jgi:hypothetical protein
MVASIISDVLGVPQVGVLDDFFALGGHSLLAARLAARLRQATDVNVPLRTVFEAPTVRGLAEFLRGARAHEMSSPVPPIRPAPRDRPLPLSFSQEHLWSMYRRFPGAGTCDVVPFRIRGALRVDLLERCLAELVRRHHALRTTFVERDGGGVQIVAPTVTPLLAVLDVSNLPEHERREALQSCLDTQTNTPFSAEHGPLLRTHLLRWSAEEHFLLIAVDHIVFDGGSAMVLWKELDTLYAAGLAGKPAVLAEPRLQYADFAAWQRARLTGDVLDRQLAYWREHLAGISPMSLVADRSRAPDSGLGRYVEHSLSSNLTAALTAFGRRQGATQPMLLLAALYVLLYRYTGDRDLCVATPLSIRSSTELEGIIGNFVNMLPLRVRVVAGVSFQEVLSAVRAVMLGGFAHQDLPFDWLFREDAIARANPFRVLFDYQPSVSLDVSLFEIWPMRPTSPGARGDLAFHLREEPERVVASILYNADIFEGASIARMLAHYERLLEAIVSTPDIPVDVLPLVSDAERNLLVAEWSNCGHQLEQYLFALGVDRKGVRIYVLDASLALVPIGVPGELCLGGAAIGNGVPAPNQLVPDPFCDAEGAQLLRTGERARFRVDGQLELLTPRDTERLGRR